MAERGRGPSIWIPAFLETLARSANVTTSVRAAGITQTTAYTRRRTDDGFAKDWDEALDQGIARLEEAARHRALDGVDEPLMYQGEVVGHVKRFDTALTIFLLKAHRPEVYRDRVDLHHSGEVKANVQFYLPSNGRGDEKKDKA